MLFNKLFDLHGTMGHTQGSVATTSKRDGFNSLLSYTVNGMYCTFDTCLVYCSRTESLLTKELFSTPQLTVSRDKTLADSVDRSEVGGHGTTCNI